MNKKLTIVFMFMSSVFANAQTLVNASKMKMLCKTWISLEMKETVPMTGQTYVADIYNRDTITIFKEGRFVRNSSDGKYDGQWMFNEDSATLICNPRSAFVGKTRPDLEELSIKNLTDSSLIIFYRDGKEGETILIKYRLAGLPK